MYSKWQHADRVVHTRKLDLGTQGGCKNASTEEGRQAGMELDSIDSARPARVRSARATGRQKGGELDGIDSARPARMHLGPCNRLQVDPVRSAGVIAQQKQCVPSGGKQGEVKAARLVLLIFVARQARSSLLS